MNKHRLTDIEEAILNLSLDAPDFGLLKHRFPELTQFFDRYAELCEYGGIVNLEISDLRQEVQILEDRIDDLKETFFLETGKRIE